MRADRSRKLRLRSPRTAALVQLDINGRMIQLSKQQAEKLRDEATGRAAASSALRDLPAPRRCRRETLELE